MSAIPAATISDIDLRRIEAEDAAAAEEISRIGALMNEGTETKEEFVRLCKLLLRFGETAKVRTLLIANSDEGDLSDQLLRSAFSDTVSLFDSAVRAFSAQFRLRLVPMRTIRTLSKVYRAELDGTPDGPSFGIPAMVATTDSEVQITLMAEGGVVADTYIPGDPKASVSLRFTGTSWVPERGR